MPNPDAVAGTEKDDQAGTLWAQCPDCGAPAPGIPCIAYQITGQWSMHQACTACGCFRPEVDLHFTGVGK